jgi:hypothetical protein
LISLPYTLSHVLHDSRVLLARFPLFTKPYAGRLIRGKYFSPVLRSATVRLSLGSPLPQTILQFPTTRNEGISGEGICNVQGTCNVES